ncbi:receptor homology region, transmembrane domain- and RING domain-containing protein 1 isoform X1 [Salvia miltiorrhiza]|uniref:receptor homology region, transmembrane domain- and RING domain-containing protein 1 isoform X1 n=1 Tax=Salvia miltiorrhiza TaxID=226208 RepID=UPI0025AC6E68|nr:receptor homology region, transmembrane domain- and RING domain-containing protein 1 isoform X1 [Salvia miltiorrhiza]
MNKFLIFTLLLCFLTDPILSIVQLSSISSSFPDTPARFTKGLNGSVICGDLWVAEPLDACSPLLDEVEDGGDESANIVLIMRGNCAFEEKIRNAQEAGFRAAIVYDDQLDHNLISMMGNPEGLWIYAVFVSNTAGETMRENARGVGGECCIISLVDETAWTVLVISFISVLAVICLLVSICFTVNQWRNCQETRTTAVDDKVVDMLPRITFGAVNLIDPIGETCIICLEDYKHGESLKVLPCRHVVFTGFHSSCVNSWLTKGATFCPVCKHDVRARMASSVK